MLAIQTFVVGPLQTNCYLLTNSQTNSAMIIDPGAEGDLLSETINEQGLKLELVFFTHAHFDHISGALPLWLNYQPPVYLSATDTSLYKTAPLAAKTFIGLELDPLIPISKLLTSDEQCQQLITEKFAPALLQHYPGHSRGLTAIYFPDLHWLFGGDLIFNHSVIGRTDFPFSNKQAMKTSLAQVVTLPGATTVYPGHEASFLLQDFHLRSR